MSFEDPQPQAQPYPRSPTAQPYRGPRRTHRETGRVEVWVEGAGYVPEDSMERLTVQERNALEEVRARARSQRDAIPLLRRFEQLNREQATGSLGQMIGNTWNLAPIAGDAEESEMYRIINRLTPRQRQGMPGAASDRDVAMFRGSLPGLNVVGPANSSIIRNLEREAAESQAYAEFLDWYWPRRGTTSGAEEAWRQYLASNPDWENFYDPNGMQRGWRSHFERSQRPEGQGQEPRPTAPQRPDPLGIR
jgi:hypothetical protein